MISYLKILESAYSTAKNKYKAKKFSLEDLVSDLASANLIDAEQTKKLGMFYNEILKDARFIYCGNKQWCLREYLKLSEVNSYKNSLFDIVENAGDMDGDASLEPSASVLIDDADLDNVDAVDESATAGVVSQGTVDGEE
ncbi:MAG: DNA-directed RNA polymerase subunit delta [Mycoplasmataceae bacterium]|nr:DNA-directed RNA polymerase subunit delta [Mycoplasmataceae bacterium]